MDIPVASLVVDNVTIKGEVSYQFELINLLTNSSSRSVRIRPATGSTTLLCFLQLGVGGMDGLLGTADDLKVDGQYAIRVKAKDNYGNVSYWSAQQNFKIDLNAPKVVSYSAPATYISYNRVGGVQTFSIDITESNLKSCRFYIKDLLGQTL